MCVFFYCFFFLIYYYYFYIFMFNFFFFFSTGAQAGLVEFLNDADSIDKIKKTLPKGMGLRQYFELNFGESYSVYHAKAVKNFVRSLVGYSLLTYVVQVKDRHNANILVDQEGHLIHIDFGYILGGMMCTRTSRIYHSRI